MLFFFFFFLFASKDENAGGIELGNWTYISLCTSADGLISINSVSRDDGSSL